MNKRFTLPALLCAGALLLTGCGRETDLSKRYPDYFKYSFGDGAKFTYQKNDDDDEDHDSYLLEFTDSTGYTVSYEARKAQWTQTHDTEYPFLADLREELIKSYD